MSDLLSICQKPIVSDENTSLNHIIVQLLTNDISRIILTRENSPIGMISEKDIGLFLLRDDTELNLDDICASEIMHKLLSVHASTDIESCAEIMLEKGIGSLGVTSDKDELVGIVTKTDIAKYFSKKHKGEHTVGDVMTISYISVNSDDTLKDVISKMIEDKISRIFLKNKNGEPEGILTFRDLFHVALEQGNSDSVLDNSDGVISVVFTRKGFLSESGFGKTILAKDVMTKTFESVDFEEDLAVACDAMAQNRINGVGVRIKDNLGGVLSKTDVLKAIYADNVSK